MSIAKTTLVERARDAPTKKLAAQEFALIERPILGATLVSDEEGRGRWLLPILLSLSADYTIAEGDFVVAGMELVALVTCGASDILITLPSPTPQRTVLIKKIDAGTGKVRVMGTIDSEDNYELTIPNNFVRVVGDDTQWYVIGNN